MQSTPPLVSIIILNWNGERYLQSCLEAVAAQTFSDYEVFVLDNASTDQSAEELDKRWPTFRVVRFEQNLGFAIANNRGAALAGGEWLAFLNNDAFPETEWLLNLVKASREHPQYSFFSSRLVYAGQPDLIQSSGDVYNISGYAWPRDNNRPAEKTPTSCGEVFSPCAAAAFYKRTAFLEAGGFDEDFSSHHEDVELGFRLRLLGHRCLYAPDAVVAHLGSASYGRESDRTVYQVQRNVVWAFVTDMPDWLLWRYLPAHILANLIFLIYYTLRGQPGSVWRAKWHALRSLPTLKAKRKRIQQTRRVGSAEIDRVLDHNWLGPFTLGEHSRKIRQLLERPGKNDYRSR
jgi:GT2 family glycosyltransferase